jgi:hypothetical protein
VSNSFTPLPEAPAVEKAIALDMLKRGLPVAPVAVVVAALFGGADIAASVAYGIAIVLVNLLLSALMLGWAARQTPTILMMVALGGFFVRMGIVTAAILAVKDQDWVALTPLAVAVLVASLGLLFWELRYVSLSFTYPGLKPTSSSQGA